MLMQQLMQRKSAATATKANGKSDAEAETVTRNLYLTADEHR